MPTYNATDPTTGKSVSLDGASPPTEDELNQIFSQVHGGTQPIDQSPLVSATKSAVKNLLIDVPKSFSSPKNITQTYGSIFPGAGAAAGSMIAPGIGTATGAGLGAIVQRGANIAYGNEPPTEMTDSNATLFPSSPKSMFKESIAPMAQTAIAGLPETQGVQDIASNLGRRALGFSKGMLKRIGIEGANKTADQMLDSGVITPFTGAGSMADKAENLMNTSGKMIGQTLKQAGASPIDTNALGDSISNQLGTKMNGGVYGQQNVIVGDILDTVGAHGNGPISFESAQQLKQTLGDMARFNSNTDAMKSNLYRRAYGIVSDAIDNGLQQVADSGQIPKQLIQDFLKNKQLYGSAARAFQALIDKSIGEASRNLVSLPSVVMGAGGLATGDLGTAAEGLGVTESLKRIGPATGAYFLRGGPVQNMVTKPLESMATGKVLDLLTAKKYLKDAGGDRDKARQTALADGYNVNTQ